MPCPLDLRDFAVDEELEILANLSEANGDSHFSRVLLVYSLGRGLAVVEAYGNSSQWLPLLQFTWSLLFPIVSFGGDLRAAARN